jgi:hypothetical protein
MPESIDPTPTEPSMVGTAALTAAGTAEFEDVALGCECANPALQIERWHQEAGDDVH